ncbi:phytoene desaturase family protein [Syntrophomonas curvata]
MSKYDVVVIGAGLAGLSVAALMTKKENKKVLVVERENYVGGRLLSFTGAQEGVLLHDQKIGLQDFKRALASVYTRVFRSEPDLATIFKEGLFEGWSFEAGGHATFWGDKGKVACLFNYLGIDVDLPGNEGFAIIDPGQEGLFKLTKGGRFEWMSEESGREAKKLLKEMALATPGQLKEWSKISLGDWMRERTQDQKVYEFIAAISAIHMVMGEPDMTPAGDFIQFMTNASKIGMNLISGSTGVVPKPGFIRLGELLAEMIKQNGGEILINTPVKEVIISDKKAVGVKVSEGNNEKIYEAGQIVCTALPKSMFNIISESNFPESFVNHIKKDFWSPGMVTGYVGMKSNMLELAGLNPKSWILIPSYIKSTAGFIGDVDDISIIPSAFSPSLAPEGKSTFAFSIALTEPEILNEEKVNSVIDGALNHVKRVFPTWDEDLEWAIFTASSKGFGDWPPIGELRPENKSPWVHGLFFAGDCYGETVLGSGMDAAIHSAVACVDKMVESNYAEEILPPYHRLA